MTTTSRVPAVLDYLVAAFAGSATLGAHPTAPVAVYDGPVLTEAPSQLTLWVGMDDPDSAEAPVAADSESQWAALGNLAQDETISVHCVAEAWSGDTDVRAVRLAAFGIVAAAESLLRADATLGGTLPSGWCRVTGRQLRANNVEAGAVARVSFRVDCWCRI